MTQGLFHKSGVLEGLCTLLVLGIGFRLVDPSPEIDYVL